MVGTLIVPLAGMASFADDRTVKDVTIPQDDNVYWKIKTVGKIEFTVDVVEGGPVDVLITQDLPVGFVIFFEKWENVRNLDDSFSTGDDTEVYLLIDNTNEVGASSIGDVRVHVEWETTGEAAGWLLSVLVPIIIVIVIILSIVLRFASRGRSRGGTDEVIVEEVYVDEQGRPIARSERVQMEPSSRGGPVGTQWCPNCGAEMGPHPRTGRLFCQHCAEAAQASPRPPRQDE